MRHPLLSLLVVAALAGGAWLVATSWAEGHRRLPHVQAKAAAPNMPEPGPAQYRPEAGSPEQARSRAPERDGPTSGDGRSSTDDAAKRTTRERRDTRITTGAGFSTWPSVAARTTTVASEQVPAAEPTVPVKVAFRALWYLGIDPAAETTWLRAINDPALSAGVRSDLIVDMTDEGYTDNERPTVADLPLIRARLDILERHAPYALDEVNRRAFEEAYRGLLTIYLRLGGEPR